MFVILGLGFAARVGPAWPFVFRGPGEVRLFDTDSYYHLRHARFAAAHFPMVQRWDPGTYPAGQPALYAGLFDVGIAAVAWIAGAGRPDDALVERVAVWISPVLAALVFTALFSLGRAVSGPGGGLLAALLLLLYPGTFVYRSLLGASDHHVAEVLLALLLVLGMARCLQARQDEAAIRWWRPAILPALPLAVLFFTWFGAPIYLVLVGVTFFVVVSMDLARGESGAGTARAACRYGLGLLVLLVPVSLLTPWLVMDSAHFWKAILAAALLTGGLPLYARGLSWLSERVRGKTPASRFPAAALALLGAAVVGLGFWTATRIIPGADGLAGQLLGPKTSLVKEQFDVTLENYARLGGVPAFLAVAALPWVIAQAWQHREEPFVLATIVFATLVVGLWLRTRDYGYVAPVFLAFLATFVLRRGARLFSMGRFRLGARVAGVALIAAAVIVPIWPARAVLPPVPEAAAVKRHMLLGEGWVQALRWMKAKTAPLERPLDAPVARGTPFRHPPGNYGVQAFWDFGHFVAGIGARPPLASGGITAAQVRWFLLTDEEQAVKALTVGLGPREHVRYCIADAQTAGEFFLTAVSMVGESRTDYVETFAPTARRGASTPPKMWRYGDRYRRSMAARLYVEDGNGLAHFRLVYASREWSSLAHHSFLDASVMVRTATVLTDQIQERAWKEVLARGVPVVASGLYVYDGTVGPSVKVFEQVAGAHLSGVDAPGVVIEASLLLRAEDGRHEFVYRRSVTADASGRFDLVVPYPTERDATGTDVLASGPYEIRALEDSHRLLGRIRVGSDDVRGGARVSVSAATASDGAADASVGR